MCRYVKLASSSQKASVTAEDLEWKSKPVEVRRAEPQLFARAQHTKKPALSGVVAYPLKASNASCVDLNRSHKGSISQGHSPQPEHATTLTLPGCLNKLRLRFPACPHSLVAACLWWLRSREAVDPTLGTLFCRLPTSSLQPAACAAHY